MISIFKAKLFLVKDIKTFLFFIYFKLEKSYNKFLLKIATNQLYKIDIRKYIN